MQDWIVYIIVILCFLAVGRRIYLMIRRSKNNDDPCANCITGCDLKRMFDEKQQECNEKQQKSKEKTADKHKKRCH